MTQLPLSSLLASHVKEDPSVAVFVWHTESKTLTLIKEFAPGREAVAHGVVAGLYEKDKHDSPLQAAKYEVSRLPAAACSVHCMANVMICHSLEVDCVCVHAVAVSSTD